MKHAGRWIAAIGCVGAVILFVSEGIEPIVGLLLGAGWGLVIAVLFHVVPMALNARAWQCLMRPTRLSFVSFAVWVRESVNGLLPVARIGGEIASYRLLAKHGIPRAEVAASLVVDMAVSLASQGVFCLAGVALLIGTHVASPFVVQLAGGCVVLLVLPALFALLQGTHLVERVLRTVERLLADRWSGAVERSERVDRAIRALCRQRGRLLACFAWQLAGWAAGAGEIWLALHFLGRDQSLAHALMIEALVQIISSVAFVVPGAIGVQEAGFLAIGAALGLDGPTSLALSAARRIRDLVLFFPGLLAWQRAESNGSALARR